MFFAINKNKEFYSNGVNFTTDFCNAASFDTYDEIVGCLKKNDIDIDDVTIESY